MKQRTVLSEENDLGPTVKSTTVIMEQSNQNARFNIKLWGWSLLSLVPWAINAGEKIQRPTTINKELKRYARPRVLQKREAGNPVRFRPYVSKVPWHKGPRAFLSQLFPRYGHYCGPNWSSGKNSGSNLWDRRPMDWLDYCCYCHDIGYDTHDQTELLKADLAFVECLERPHMDTRGDARVAHLYKTMCITGLKNILIPYRKHLVRLQTGNPIVDFGWLISTIWRTNLQKT
ncbi:hypothetical protein KPL70_002727 [Citrus sinensis]|nr:hypothetical protein KPL70_002727 [Citrus sinensis]